MAEAIENLAVYLHLANAAWKKLQMPDRDRLLVISAVHASQLGLDKISHYCRFLILKNNPGHMVRRWAGIREAVQDPDFLHFYKQVQRRFSVEKAETMLAEMGIVRANERATYYTDEEYAAALLGVDQEWLQQMFGET